MAARPLPPPASHPSMKMTTAIPPEITTPDNIETRLGTLELFDGFPDDPTTQKVYTTSTSSAGIQAFLNAMPGAAVTGLEPIAYKAQMSSK